MNDRSAEGRRDASQGPTGSFGPFAIIIQRGKGIVYINATSTRECMFALGFTREYA